MHANSLWCGTIFVCPLINNKLVDKGGLVMLNKDKKCLYSFKQSYFFSDAHVVSVFEGDKDNVLVNSTYYTISKKDIERIKDLIRNSKYIFNISYKVPVKRSKIKFNIIISIKIT